MKEKRVTSSSRSRKGGKKVCRLNNHDKKKGLSTVIRYTAETGTEETCDPRARWIL